MENFKNAFVIAILAFVGISQAAAQDWKPVLQGPYANELKQCRDSWATISNDADKVARCMEKLVYAIAPRFSDPKGIPAIGTPSFDPIVLKHLELANTPVLQGNVTNLSIYNGSVYLVPGTCKITYDPKEKLATMVTNGKVAIGYGDYSLRLNLGALLSAGGAPPADSGTATTGRVMVKATDMLQTIKLFMRETKSGKGLTVAKTDSSITFKDMELNFKPDRPDDPLGNLLNSMITGDSALSLMTELMTPANRATSLGIGSLFYKGWWKLDQL